MEGNVSVPAKNEVAIMSGAAIAPVSDSSALIHIIERAARDPSVDLDKLERLIAMRERIEAREADRAFDQAMSRCQSEMRPVAADANNPQTRSKYASYFALDRALRPIYTAHGFALSFDTGDGAPDQHVRVICRVSHSGGQARIYRIDMPNDGKGAKGGDVMTRTHATGSAATYGSRYLLRMIFNVAVGGDDDDGNKSGADDRLSPDQVAALKKLIEDTGGDVAKFCKFAKVDTLGDIFANRYDAAVAAVNRAAEDRKKR
jgi:hypothetical protein